MKYGVKNVVITDTDTIIGYSVLSITPSDVPRVAMINENSPICTSENPDSMAMRSGCPVISMPPVPNTIMPTITIAERMRIGTV